MTSVADTRLLLTLQFPPDEKVKDKVQTFFQKETISGIVILPSIVLSEFLKIAGTRIGIESAVGTISILKEQGMRVKSLDEALAMEAGKLLLRHRQVPLADSLIAAFASSKIADYILSDDPHFKTLGARTKWFS